ncbi:MAG: helix-turn-helix domain-containing protein [Clostridiales bacterium]|nr:helix-turn-helix domain-containing protein [Clostridiales bacterium]
MLEVQIINSEQAMFHLHEDVELVYVMEGQACVEINDHSYTLKENDMIVINSNNRHRILRSRYDTEEAWWLCQIHISYRELLEDLQSDFALFWCNSAVSDSGEYRVLAEILDEILETWGINEPGNYLKKSIYYKLIGCLSEHFLVTGMENRWSRKSKFEREELLSYMNANYFRSITLKEMADRVYMSETAFSKYFKKMAGMNFVQYMNNIRLHHAIEDLLYSDKPMTRIAVDNGFASPSFFNRVFKSIYHMTPTEYRENAGAAAREPAQPQPLNHREIVADYLEKKSSKISSEKLEKYIYGDMDNRRSYEKIWTRAFNLGNAPELLSARLQRQIAFVHKEIPFTYGQINNLFGWEMKLRENHTFTALNFELVDEVLDFLTDHRIVPVIDLGDKPRHTLLDFDQAIYMETRKKVYESLEEYEKVLGLFMEHVTKRYGMEWVSRWMFHVWFDPGEAYENAVVTVMKDYDYIKVFKTTAKVVKSYGETIRVGGAGFVMGNMHYPVLDFLSQCRELECLPDYISMYIFPYCHIDESDVLGSAIRPHTHFLSAEIENYRKLAQEYGIGHIPLYVMEWNMSLSQRNFYNDGCGKAALMLKNMTDNLESAWMCAYSLLSDLDSDYYDSPKLLIGAAGLLTKEGIPKPCYYALKFMDRLADELVLAEDGCVITADRGGRYKILCFNYKAVGQSYYLRRESDFRLKDLDHMYEDRLDMTLHFTLTNMDNGSWRIHRYRVSPKYGSVLGVWEQLGQDTSVREDVEYMRQMCVPRVEGEKVICKDGTLLLEETLGAHEMRLIVISK